ncbi:hypothetical protein [Glutamicibacter protophormiae]|uniref:Uncharacterized protein n=1 Tax=Glutamicibacter protophormiae TaxID=37930 RepID=A0ABS4XXS8_GLUPR|nr:hypothetical protein [Glutamicibacter protophormiae]MBP2400513.1 hypothetical protein [Glutamicibacter protophormiae]GGM01009.1 hypothetical protein GCM10010038_33850 [Glutamicibacter protophormiae]
MEISVNTAKAWAGVTFAIEGNNISLRALIIALLAIAAIEILVIIVKACVLWCAGCSWAEVKDYIITAVLAGLHRKPKKK